MLQTAADILEPRYYWLLPDQPPHYTRDEIRGVRSFEAYRLVSRRYVGMGAGHPTNLRCSTPLLSYVLHSHAHISHDILYQHGFIMSGSKVPYISSAKLPSKGVLASQSAPFSSGVSLPPPFPFKTPNTTRCQPPPCSVLQIKYAAREFSWMTDGSSTSSLSLGPRTPCSFRGLRLHGRLDGSTAKL